MTRKLFRQEAIDAQREKYLGEATIARPVPMWVFTSLAVAMAILIVVFAIWGQYTRRERVEGFLELDQGAARISIPDAGRVTRLLIKEGDEVIAGADMAVISYDRSTATNTSTSTAVTGELQQRKNMMEQEQVQLRELGKQQVQQFQKRSQDLQSEVTQIDREIKLQEQRLASANEQAQRFQKLATEKFVSDIAARQKQDEATDQEIRLQALKRQKVTLQRELSGVALEVPTAALRAQSQVDQVGRQISEIQQNLAQEDARRETVIRAPINGTVTNVAVNEGQSISADTVLATLVPKGSGLYAQLLVPTRAVGFLKKGNDVALRYEAFPYERYGQYKGTVVDVSRTVMSPGEKLGPMAIREPIYRVAVKLNQQTVNALGQEFPLRSGMLVNADILLEKRRLFEWIFEPIMQLKGRL